MLRFIDSHLSLPRYGPSPRKPTAVGTQCPIAWGLPTLRRGRHSRSCRRSGQSSAGCPSSAVDQSAVANGHRSGASWPGRSDSPGAAAGVVVAGVARGKAGQPLSRSTRCQDSSRTATQYRPVDFVIAVRTGAACGAGALPGSATGCAPATEGWKIYGGHHVTATPGSAVRPVITGLGSPTREPSG